MPTPVVVIPTYQLLLTLSHWIGLPTSPAFKSDTLLTTYKLLVDNPTVFGISTASAPPISELQVFKFL